MKPTVEATVSRPPFVRQGTAAQSVREVRPGMDGSQGRVEQWAGSEDKQAPGKVTTTRELF